jgi:hypothetical protein
MRRDRLADGRAVAVDEIEHAFRHAGIVQDFREQDGAQRRYLAGLEDGGAAGGECRRELGCDLIERPVPRRDQSADADRLAADHRRIHHALERVGRQHVDRFLEMIERVDGLHLVGERDRRPHLRRHGSGEFALALFIELDDSLEQFDARLAARRRIGCEGAARRLHRVIDILPGPKADLPRRLLGCWIDHVKEIRHGGFDPFAVDIKFRVVLAHDPLHPFGRGRVSACACAIVAVSAYECSLYTCEYNDYRQTAQLHLRRWSDASARVVPCRIVLWSQFCEDAGVEDIVDRPADSIAVIRGTSSAEVQDLFRTLVERWRPAFRLAGLIAEHHGLADRTCSAGFLRNVTSGERFSIFDDLGPGSTECHLDGTGALSAADTARRDIAAGCDLVLLSKFGKLEADGKGLFGAFNAALDGHIPLLTSLSPACQTQWEKLAGRSYTVLPADLDRIRAWWRAVRNSRADATAS